MNNYIEDKNKKIYKKLKFKSQCFNIFTIKYPKNIKNY